MVETIKNNISESIRLKTSLLNDEDIINKIYEISNIIIETYKNGNKIYFCGNGGSFADSQHLSAELNGRFYFDREPLEVVLLGSNLSYLIDLEKIFASLSLMKYFISNSSIMPLSISNSAKLFSEYHLCLTFSLFR